MAESWFSCKGCVGSDPTKDRVKVDPSLLNKENVQPLQVTKEGEQRRREAEEAAAKRQKEEAARKAVQDEARRREEEQRKAAEELQRQAAIEADRRKAEEAHQQAEEARREPLRLQQQQQEEAAAREIAMEAQSRREAEDELERKERQAAETRVKEWCWAHLFQDAHTPKKTYRGHTKYPLHTAAKCKDVSVVKALLLLGAQKDVMSSKKQTPAQYAASLNKNGSHDAVIALLS